MPPKTAEQQSSAAAPDPKKQPTAAKKAPRKRRAAATAPEQPRRVAPSYEEDDILLAGHASNRAIFGRCGGRILTSKLEQQLCDMLSSSGVAHSHSPRHFEVKIDEKSVAAYAPMISLRGRGREGKTVIVEGCEAIEPVTLGKIKAFRRQYGLEFYVCFVAPEDTLDEVSFDTYDEAETLADARTLISRLAD